MRRLFGPSVEVCVDRTNPYAGEDVKGVVRIGNLSKQVRTYRNVQLRFHVVEDDGSLAERGRWFLIDEISVAEGAVLELPFTIPLQPQLKPMAAAITAHLEPLGLSLAGLPSVQLAIRPHREFARVVLALAAAGDSRLARWLSEPSNPAGTELFPRKATPGALYVSHVEVDRLDVGKAASGFMVTSRRPWNDGWDHQEQVTGLPFSVDLRDLGSLEKQFRAILAPLWNGASELPLPATSRTQDQDLPVPANDPDQAT